MKKTLTLMGLLWITVQVFAQNTDSLLSIEKTHLRAELRAAVQKDNRKRGAVLTDSLRYLYADKKRNALHWDERWLAYHWAERHTLLLEELKNYDEGDRLNETLYNDDHAQDGLFEALDKTMYAQSDAYPDLLQDLGLHPEQQEFLMLHLQYLLRNNTDNELQMRKSFLEQYPKSAYAPFVRTFMEQPEPKRHTWAALEVAFNQNTWRGEAERHLRPGWGPAIALLIHHKRMCYGFNMSYSFQKNLRDIYGGFEVFAKGASSERAYYGVSAQWAMLDRASMRLGPFGNIGGANFTATDPTDDDGNVISDYYADYDFVFFQAGGGVFLDLKWKKREMTPNSVKPESYKGLKFKVGYNYSNLGQKNRQLGGNLVFVSVGWQIAWVR
jgi:hypothetical protein